MNQYIFVKMSNGRRTLNIQTIIYYLKITIKIPMENAIKICLGF